MLCKDFEQLLYIGNAYERQLEDLPIYEDELGWRCLMYSESHVADPEAQFRDYIFTDVTQYAMNYGQVAVGLAGSAFKPQDVKRICQGVGGHLGEGAAALAIERVLKARPSEYSHLAVKTGRRRCPDFAVRISLNDLYEAYGLPGTGEMQRVSLPVEAKSSRVVVKNINSFLSQGAISQLASYWWEMNRLGRRRVVGHGVVTIFCHQEDTVMIHCLLRPDNPGARRNLIAWLSAIPSASRLADVLAAPGGLRQLYGFLEGF